MSDFEHPRMRAMLRAAKYVTLAGLSLAFCVSASASPETTLYSFKGGLDAAFPTGTLLRVGRSFYGTSEFGGSETGCKPYVGCGTIYKVEQDGSEVVVASFDGTNGSQLLSGLTRLGDTLYGIGYGGGASGYGTIFSVTRTGGVRTLYSFKGEKDGSYPTGTLVVVNNVLYGVTGIGGGKGCRSDRGCGTVFSITPSGHFSTLYRFGGRKDGANPQQLSLKNGVLYGVTGSGGGSGCYSGEGCGTVFSMTTSGVETVIHRFVGGSDGASPKGALIDIDDTLYGATDIGGTTGCNNNLTIGCGVVFSISRQNIERVVYAFAGGADGSAPNSLVKVGNTLYGATYLGGAAGHGTLFSLSVAGLHSVLYSFAGGPNGDGPNSLAVDGSTLLGTTLDGGFDGEGCNYGCGTLFSYAFTGD